MLSLRSLLAAGSLLILQPNAWSADVSWQSLDVKGVKIRYFVEGKGEPVVLIHGMHSSAEMNWTLPGIVAGVAKEYQVIALDLPGHGGSDKPDKEDAYGVQMVEDIAALLDHLKIKQAHIVGYSMGGMVALKYIAKHPERTLSGILGGMGWLKDGGGLQKVWEQMPVRDGSRTPAVCIHSFGKLALTEDELKAVQVPVVVLIGDRDPVKRMYVAPLQTVRKDWPVVEIEGAGHVNCIMKKQFADEILKWLGKQRKS